MAEKNIIINVKTDIGYDKLYPRTVSDNVYVGATTLTEELKKYGGAINLINGEGIGSLKQTVPNDPTWAPNQSLGTNSIALGNACVVQSTGIGALAHNDKTVASGSYSHAEGKKTVANGVWSHAEGNGCYANGDYSHAEGQTCTANGVGSHAGGNVCFADGDFSFNIGQYNSRTNRPSAFVIGNGTSNLVVHDGFIVDNTGNVYATRYNTQGADFSELYEWEDGNLLLEDRRGLFVTLKKDKIVLANDGDYILGGISATPSIIGNSNSEWDERFKKDIFGNWLFEDVTVPIFEYKMQDERLRDGTTGTTNKVLKKVENGTKIEKHWIINPTYDATKEYKLRTSRKEWDCVGSQGQLIMVDDGTCIEDGYCKCGKNGVGTKAISGYRVMKRLDPTHIKIVMETIRDFK